MNGNKGFSYPAALLMVIAVSISLMTARKQWSTIVQKEREKELIFRGGQIVKAITSYHDKEVSGKRKFPEKFEYLLKDNRYPGVKRHLRKLYKDPMTEDGKWGIIYELNGGIKGVFSLSNKEPIKKYGFSERYKHFNNKKKYREWKFVYEENRR